MVVKLSRNWNLKFTILFSCLARIPWLTRVATRPHKVASITILTATDVALQEIICNTMMNTHNAMINNPMTFRASIYSHYNSDANKSLVRLKGTENSKLFMLIIVAGKCVEHQIRNSPHDASHNQRICPIFPLYHLFWSNALFLCFTGRAITLLSLIII